MQGYEQVQKKVRRTAKRGEGEWSSLRGDRASEVSCESGRCTSRRRREEGSTHS